MHVLLTDPIGGIGRPILVGFYLDRSTSISNMLTKSL
jgi:hypothetical protein